MNTVAIVGRPNVGKSTLFNRIAGRRIAIVDPTYGLTRDRISASASHSGKRLTIVDTGGIDFDISDNIREMARRQAELAIEQADIVILVTDVQEGLVPLDIEIAGMLRRAGKRMFVAANKADNDALEAASSEFHRLGFPDLFPVSAAHGRGVPALLDAVAACLSETVDEKAAEPFKIAVVGKPNVGKSSYVNRILREERMIIDETPGTTRDSVDIHTVWNGRRITLIDTAGMRKARKVATPAEFFSLSRARASIRRCDLALMLIAADEGLTAQDERLARYILDAGKGCVLGVNKWDLARGVPFRRYREAIWHRMRFFDYVPLVFMSAKTGQGVDRSLRTAFFVREQMEKRIATPLLNRTLHGLWARNEPPVRGKKRCRFFYAAQTGVKPPAFRLFVNDRDLLDTDYINYLVNGLRRAFGFEGTPVRFEPKNRR